MIVMVKATTPAKMFVEPLKEVWQIAGQLFLEDRTGNCRKTSLNEITEIDESDIEYRWTNGMMTVKC